MTAHYEDGPVTIHLDDCLNVMREMPDNSVDAVVTDPPYGLSNTDPGHVVETLTRWLAGDREYLPTTGGGFMGKSWDAFVPPVAVWDEALRVLKPGGHLLCFAGTRTVDLMGLAIRLAGFEIRDSVAFLYGSGFPKSLDVSKAIDRRRDEDAAGACLETVRTVTRWIRDARDAAQLRNIDIDTALGTNGMAGHYTSAASQPHVPTAEAWPTLLDLFGVEQPPEHVRVAVDEWLRIKGQPAPTWSLRAVTGTHSSGLAQGSAGVGAAGAGKERRDIPATPDAARWNGWGTALKPAFEPIVVARKPLTGTVAANVLAYGTGALNIDGSRIGTTDDLNGGGYSGKLRQRDDYTSTDTAPGAVPLSRLNRGIGEFVQPAGRWPANVVLDASQAAALDQQSGTSRSTASAGRNGRDATWGLNRTDDTVRGHDDEGGASRFFKTVDDAPRFMYTAKAGSGERPGVDGVSHPTVKPVDLMRWLVKLVTPPGGTVLEPFAGSGTTVEAAVLEGFQCIAIEREADYLPLILKRIRKPHAVGLDFGEWEA